MSYQTVVNNHINDSCIKEKKLSEKNSRSLNASKNIFTREEIQNLVKSTVSFDAELFDYQLRPYSEEKIGFLASHQALTITAKRCKKLEKRNFFVKTIPYDIPSQASYIKEKGVFRKEVDFFKLIVPLLTENYQGKTWSPRCYLVKDDTIVFEDMRFKGFSNRAKLLDEQSIKLAIACIARFHASSLLAEEKLNGKSLKDLYPHVFEESEYKRTGRSYAWFITAINLAISIAKDLKLDTSAIFRTSKRVFDIAQPSKNKHNVVSHGDLWSNNLLFDNHNHCNVVDFQLIRYAPLAHDVMQMLYLTTTRDFRENNEGQIVEYYYAALKEALIINKFSGVIPTFEEIQQGVEEQRFPALVGSVINYPTIMIDGKIGDTIMNDADAYEAYFFCDRRPFVDKIMALDREYEKRIKESVIELAEMSLKADNFPRPT